MASTQFQVEPSFVGLDLNLSKLVYFYSIKKEEEKAETKETKAGSRSVFDCSHGGAGDIW